MLFCRLVVCLVEIVLKSIIIKIDKSINSSIFSYLEHLFGTDRAAVELEIVRGKVQMPYKPR